MDELFVSLSRWGTRDDKQDERLAAIETFLSQPHVQNDILSEEARTAEYEREHPDQDIWYDEPPYVWFSEQYNNLFCVAIDLGIDIVPHFFSPPWVDRIPSTLRTHVSCMMPAVMRRPNRLELLETILSSAPFCSGNIRFQMDELRRFARDQDVQSLLIAHGLETAEGEEQEENPSHRKEIPHDQSTPVETFATLSLYDASADF